MFVHVSLQQLLLYAFTTSIKMDVRPTTAQTHFRAFDKSVVGIILYDRKYNNNMTYQ